MVAVASTVVADAVVAAAATAVSTVVADAVVAVIADAEVAGDAGVAVKASGVPPAAAMRIAPR
jgi:hypothetical protein